MLCSTFPKPPKANPVRLRVGKHRETDLRGFKVFTGKVVGEYADFYLVKAKSGYNTTMHKNALGIDWMATKLNGGK